jgi:leucine efflux protein
MLGITNYWAFVAAILVFLALPGPGTFALLSATGKGGFGAGAAATAGLLVGDQLLLWLAVLGIAAVLQGHPALFKSLQYAGAAYLAYVGLRLAFSRSGGTPTTTDLRPDRYFRQALLITLLNPKAIVFYMAFFPLFIDPVSRRGVITFGAMAITIAILTLSYCLALAAFAHAVTVKVRAHRVLAGALRRAAGFILVGFGLKLAQ